MSLQRKLLLALVVPALVLGAIGSIGVSSLYRLSRAANEILSDNYQSIQDARRMERVLRRLEEIWQGRGGGSAAAQAIPGLASQFANALAECEANITEHGEEPVLLDVQRLWEQLAAGLGRRETAGPDERAREVVAVLYERIDTLVDMNERAMFAHERRTLRSARLAVGVMGTSLLAALAVLVLFAHVAARRISRPILDVADNLHNTLKISALADTRRTPSGDEIERLGVELENLLKRLALYEDEQTGKMMRLRGRLAFVMEGVHEGLVLVDEKLAILDLNKTARNILGVTAHDPLGQELNRLSLSEDVGKVLLPALETTLDAERSLPDIKCSIDRADRTYRPRVLPLVSDMGRAEGFLIVFWDVTEERQFEEARRSFIAMLSHQLKTPVTSLAMSVSLLWERFRGQTNETDELLTMAKADCSSLASLVDELVGAARDMTSNLVLRSSRIDVVRLVRESLRPLVPQARERGVDLRDGMGAQPIFIKGDPVKLPWVVTNLVGNALRYTPAGGSITIGLEAARKHVVISVSDTGKGIARENLDRLFVPFTSLDNHDRPSLHGLGLVIAKEIVEAHNGSIEVESDVGAGTTFTVRFPREPGEKP